jgi:hypothetical protein
VSVQGGEKTIKLIVKLTRGKYQGFNDHHSVVRKSFVSLALMGSQLNDSDGLQSAEAVEREERHVGCVIV